jgi:hypothetical protein
MKSLRIVLVGVIAMAGSALLARPALADVSPHCTDGGYCLFSGTNFTGTKAVVPSGAGCRQVSGLGFPVAHSAARGFGDSAALQLYSDSTCTTQVATVFSDVPSTTAVAYRLLPVPS